MADYYQNASFTIMAAVPPGKRSQGLFHVPEGDLYRLARLPYRDKEGNRKGHFYVSCHLDPARETLQHNQIRKNDILSRGWVFQEWALSRRIAWYTEHGLTLRCKCRNVQHQGESLINIDPSPSLHRILPLLGMVIPKHRWDRYRAVAPPFRSPLDWQSLVSQYSTMQLTKPEEDRLVALSGVAQEFTTQESSAKLVCGLRPWCLGIDLLWKQDSAGIHSRYTEFPSWSWASVNTPVSWIPTDDATDCFTVISVSSTPGGRSGIPAGAGGNSASPAGNSASTAHQAITTSAFAPEASMNTLNIRCRLLLVVFGPVLKESSRDLVFRASRYQKEEPPIDDQPRAVALAMEKDTVAGWGSLEEPDLQLDDAFARNPVIFALCVSVLTVPRGSGLFSKIWGDESIFNVVFVRPSSAVTNGFERVGVGRLFGIALELTDLRCDPIIAIKEHKALYLARLERLLIIANLVSPLVHGAYNHLKKDPNNPRLLAELQREIREEVPKNEASRAQLTNMLGILQSMQNEVHDTNKLLESMAGSIKSYVNLSVAGQILQLGSLLTNMAAVAEIKRLADNTELMAETLQGIENNLNSINARGDYFPQHVYSYVRMMIERHAHDEIPHYFFVFHESHEWHPKFEDLRRETPLGPHFVGYNDDLDQLVAFLVEEFRPRVGTKPVLHILLPTVKPLAITESLTFPPEMRPFCIEGQKGDGGLPFVFMCAPLQEDRQCMKHIGALQPKPRWVFLRHLGPNLPLIGSFISKSLEQQFFEHPPWYTNVDSVKETLKWQKH
ncbi:transcription factor Zn C2H2 [Fusarium sp. NRRL 52700]|nr:transcription factor Zn C2H2 [Fusarium sp. NRRL 52700]